MNKQIIYMTNQKCYTSEELKAFKATVSNSNMDILLANLTEPLLARFIEGFTEQNGILFFSVGGEMISVTHKS
jgi:hypothetical protein